MSQAELIVYNALEYVNFAFAFVLFILGIFYFVKMRSVTRYIKLSYAINAAIIMGIYLAHWIFEYNSPIAARIGATLILVSLIVGTLVSYYRDKRNVGIWRI